MTATEVPAEALWVPDVARRAGLSEATVSRYNSAAEIRRRAGESKPRDLPEPNGYAYPPGRKSGSKAPWWLPRRLEPWFAARQGITPGAPRKDGSPAVRKTATHARPGPKGTAKPAPRTRRRAAA